MLLFKLNKFIISKQNSGCVSNRYSLFEYCPRLENIELPNSIKTIGDEVFRNTSIKSIVIPDSVISLGTYIFGNCKQLEKVDYPSSIKNIPKGTFYGCSNLKEIIIYKDVDYDYCFTDARIKKVIIEDGIEVFDFGFLSNSFIDSLILPDSIKEIKGIFNLYTESITINSIDFEITGDCTLRTENLFCYENALKKIYNQGGINYVTFLDTGKKITLNVPMNMNDYK